MTDDVERKCELLDKFAVFVQGILAIIAFSTLILKRQREHPQRPFKVWAFDASKQAFGAGMVHCLNIAFSYISVAYSPHGDNPCVWYFLNILLDTTFGVLVIYLLLKVVKYFISYFDIPDMESGFYGNPPSLWIWWKQAVVFFGVLSVMKLIVLACLAIFPFLELFAKMLLTPLFDYPKLELVVVMLIFPLVMNIFQFWVVDQVIKGSAFKRPLDSFMLDDNDDTDIYQEGDDSPHSSFHDNPLVLSEPPPLGSMVEHRSRSSSGSSSQPLSPIRQK